MSLFQVVSSLMCILVCLLSYVTNAYNTNFFFPFCHWIIQSIPYRRLPFYRSQVFLLLRSVPYTSLSCHLWLPLLSTHLYSSHCFKSFIVKLQQPQLVLLEDKTSYRRSLIEESYRRLSLIED